MPVTQTLKSLLISDLWQNCVLTQYPEPPSSDALCDVSHGQLFKANQFFIQNPTCLKLILYQDPFEVVNPLGLAKKKHKVLAVYLSLANLPSHIRSSVDFMPLVLLCSERDFKDFGHDRVFSELLKDLKFLEENGIDVSEQTVKGTVYCIAGDNLGSHNVGGFTDNFSVSEYFCRYCQVTRSDFKVDPNVCGPRRTAESYSSAVYILQAEDKQHVEGIAFESVFNSLNHYNACLTGLPLCLGHDLFEGVVSYDLALYLKYFIKEKRWFSYPILNRCIK